MPRQKSNTKKQRLNTTVKPLTATMLDVIAWKTELDRGQTLDAVITRTFCDMGLTTADIDAYHARRSGPGSPVPD